MKRKNNTDKRRCRKWKKIRIRIRTRKEQKQVKKEDIHAEKDFVT